MTLVEKVGSGGFGEVYFGLMHGLDVAVKVVCSGKVRRYPTPVPTLPHASSHRTFQSIPSFPRSPTAGIAAAAAGATIITATASTLTAGTARPGFGRIFAISAPSFVPAAAAAASAAAAGTSSPTFSVPSVIRSPFAAHPDNSKVLYPHTPTTEDASSAASHVNGSSGSGSAESDGDSDDDDVQQLREALELAVLSTVKHPHILQVSTQQGRRSQW